MTSRPAEPWRVTLAPFVTPCTRRGLLAVATSAGPYLALTAAIYATLGVSLPLTVALTILAAGFLVRVFVVFHDCAHGPLLPSRHANTMLGTAMGALVLSPFVRWRHDHAVHDASGGDLDRRGVRDIVTLRWTTRRAPVAGPAGLPAAP